MFKPARMSKIQALVLDEYKDRVIKELHEQGAVEIRSVRDLGESGDMVSPGSALESSKDVISRLMRVNAVLDAYKEVIEPPKGALGIPLPPEKMEFEDIDTSGLLEEVDDFLDQCEDESRSLKESMEENAAKINEYKDTLPSLEALEDFDFNLDILDRYNYTFSLAGEVPEGIKIEEELPDSVVIAREEEERTVFILVELKENEAQVMETLRKNNFKEYDLPEESMTPRDAISHYKSRIKDLEKGIRDKRARLKALGEKFNSKALALKELLEIERERGEIFSRFVRTDRTYILEGFIPDKKSEKIKKSLESRSNGYAIVEFKEPQELEDEIPVKLDNPKRFRPFEMLTELFALPRYNEVDPTMFMVFSFLIYFGLMLTDAAYGIIVVLLGFAVKRTMGRVSPGARDMGIILMAAGVFTIVFGVLFGSYFGNLFDPGEGGFFGVSIPPLWFGQFDNTDVLPGIGPVLFLLILSLTIGILHIGWGSVIGLKRASKGGLKDMGEHIWILGAFIAVILAVVGMLQEISMLFNLAGLIFLVAVLALIYSTGGLFVFSITGLLGDVLSYSRLLALSLATGGIALSVNVMANMLGEIAVIGTVMAIVVFFIGHLFNLAINSLGAFVHSLRLHYVEYFSKFYEGGGDKFAPFKTDRIYTKIKGGK